CPGSRVHRDLHSFPTRRSSDLYNLNSANTNDSLQAIAQEMAPKLSAHSDEINLNAKLFQRVKFVYDNQNKFALDAEDKKLLEERSEEHTSELQSRENLVCRLLL